MYTKPYVLMDSPFSAPERIAIEEHVKILPFRPAPAWLGHFGIAGFRLCSINKSMASYVAAYPMAPLWLCSIVWRIKGEGSYIQDNTVFVQRYTPGDYVKEHRDPKNNVGTTAIHPFGTWTGGYSRVEEDRFLIEPSHYMGMICWGESGSGREPPKHSLEKIESGTRYAVILNRIVSGDKY